MTQEEKIELSYRMLETIKENLGWENFSTKQSYQEQIQEVINLLKK